MTLNAWVLAVAMAAAPVKPAASPSPKKGEAGSSTMKDLVKSAVAQDTKKERTVADGPDVEKLPFTPDSIKTVVLFHQTQIQGCYEETLAVKNKAVEGVLKTSWVIGPDGNVKKAKIEKKGTTLKDTKLYDCVVAVLSTMSFPKPSDAKDHPIEFPFSLKPQH